jgi:hypothetical protein
MTREDLIREKLNEVLLNQQPFNKDTEQGAFNKITVPLVSIENDLRELMQSETSEEISAIIGKLESNATITDSDMELIRLWVVGDAKSYVKMENDYLDWLDELNRLFLVLKDLQDKQLTLENMGKISGTTRDAIRVIGDIIYFKQQEERIANFENASKDLDSDNKLIIANILKQKLVSDQF